jgi:hypothetical protein
MDKTYLRPKILKRYLGCKSTWQLDQLAHVQSSTDKQINHVQQQSTALFDASRVKV